MKNEDIKSYCSSDKLPQNYDIMYKGWYDWNNFGPDKAELLKLVKDRAKQVYWLNPEGTYRWNTGDSVMNTYSAYCTKVFECGTLTQLERVIGTLLKTAI